MTTIDHDLSEIERAVLDAVAASRGHFRYESGHHGDLWLALDALFLDARRVRHWASVLAHRVAVCRPDLVCGPLTGGAFIAQSLAAELGADFVFAERLADDRAAVQYRIPDSLRATAQGQRALIVDDAVNAGSALIKTSTDLADCGAVLAGFASLLALGEAASAIAQEHGAPFFTLASLERGLWSPGDCPLCRSGVPLLYPDDPTSPAISGPGQSVQ
ncbi:MAG: orotate phosphoribosyltransferase [Proteobacteria bacterium]|nr:orotate phosphoribosyltransferase [Pseudomonadota bacterium]